MAQIKNIEGLTNEEINNELRNGAKFVIFQYSISIIVMSFKRNSAIYFIRAGQSTTKHSIGYTILTCVMGWWGIPWGPIYSIGSIATNVGGGKDVTQVVLKSVNSN
jgi:hypothetical protein